MATRKQQEAARRNGAKSRGPVTPEGKARSAQNNARHGLTGQTLVLQNEDPEQFRQLQDSYRSHFEPDNEIEKDLVDDLIAARWRLRRAIALETSVLDITLDRQAAEHGSETPEPTAAHRTALAWIELSGESHALTLLSRYEARLRSQYEKTLKQLRQLQAERKAAGEEPPSLIEVRWVSSDEPRTQPTPSAPVTCMPPQTPHEIPDSCPPGPAS